MSKRGPTPRPTHLRALEGVKEYRLNRDEPIPSEGQVVPPVQLPADAQAVWDRLAPDLIAKRVLSTWDVDAFSAFCHSVALYNRAAAEVERSGLSANGSVKNTKVVSPAFRVMQMAADMMRSIGSRFGLTPGDRAVLKVDGGGITSKSGPERFLN
ncbi:MAG: phage terminase small subunit P27 family [Mycobacterium sp.]